MFLKFSWYAHVMLYASRIPVYVKKTDLCMIAKGAHSLLRDMSIRGHLNRATELLTKVIAIC